MPNTLASSLRASLIAVALLLSLSACDMIQQQMGIEDQAAKEARADADGKAVGGACRQSGRAIEDCYANYSWLPKASTYEGWRDMDAYMRDNKLETVEPQLPPVAAPVTPGAKKKAAAAAAATAAAAAEDPAATKKAAEKH